MAYYEDEALEGLDFAPKAVVFAKTDGRPKLVRLCQVDRYLKSGDYVKDFRLADNPDRAMIGEEMAKVMSKADRNKRIIHYLNHRTIPRLIKPFKEASVRFHESFERLRKAEIKINKQ